jgi:hypothetical protein
MSLPKEKEVSWWLADYWVSSPHRDRNDPGDEVELAAALRESTNIVPAAMHDLAEECSSRDLGIINISDNHGGTAVSSSTSPVTGAAISRV